MKKDSQKLRIVIAKGRIFRSVAQLLTDAGIKIQANDRDYNIIVRNLDVEMKMMKPQNIPKIVELGSHDVGFTGLDWVMETDSNVHEVMDFGFDPVRIVAAIPEEIEVEELKKQKVVVASEYEQIARSYLEREGYNYVLLKTFGATEVFPPDDADMIIDNTSTGTTLRENRLKIIDTVTESSTRFIANKEAMQEPWKVELIEHLELLFKSTQIARKKVILEMNVPKDKLEETIRILPCMRAPTVSPLYGDAGYAVKIAVDKDQVIHLIPQLKKLDVSDILEYDLRKVIA